MTTNFATIARTNRLIALAALADRKAKQIVAPNVRQFPSNRVVRESAVFSSIRSAPMVHALAA